MIKFPAKISYSRQDKSYLVSFPDFPNVNTFGASLEEAIANAQEALSLSIEVDFERGFKMPEPSKLTASRIYQIPLPLHIEVAIRLRQIRGSRTQEQIAKRLKIAPQAYQKFENPRKCNLTLRKLEELERALQHKFDLIVCEGAPHFYSSNKAVGPIRNKTAKK